MLPVDGFVGTMQAFIQTRRPKKKKNRLATVSLFRNFEPALRKLDSWELNPRWRYPEDKLMNEVAEVDSVYRRNSGQWLDEYLLEQVDVRGKQRFNSLKRTIKFEREILGYYDIPRALNRLWDSGEAIENFPVLMEKLNPNISRTTGEDEIGSIRENYVENYIKEDYIGLKYDLSPITFLVNGMSIGNVDREIFLDKELEAIRTVTLYRNMIDAGAVYMMNEKTNRIVPIESKSLWTFLADELDASEVSIMNSDFGNKDSDGKILGIKQKVYVNGNLKLRDKPDGHGVKCSIVTVPYWGPEKNYKANKGIRYTYIQGYEQPLEFYSPVYPAGAPAYAEDRRRTLYWNPEVQTNEKGEAVIECYNAGRATSLTISVETLHKGVPAGSISHSVSY